jgi:tetratricopeptide (TPR) repeat protein
VRGQWRALQFLGELGVASDAADVAVEWLERALALARTEGMAPAVAIGVHAIGVARWVFGDLEHAEELVAESVAQFRGLAGCTEKIPSPLNIAEIRTSQTEEGRPGLRLVFEDTLQPFVETTCDAAASYALANQAGIARGRGELERAHALLHEATARFEAAGDDGGLATVLVRRAYVSLAEGDLTAARAGLQAALELRTRRGDRRGRGLVLAGLGLIETTAGAFAEAERLLAEAYELFRRAGDRWGIASTLWRRADLAFARGRLDDAEAALHEARAVLGATQRERWIATTLAALAEVALARGEAERAAVLLAEARTRYASRDDALGVASVDERLASLAK